MQLEFATWRIECDVDATRSAYAALPAGSGCSCNQCRNFDAAAGKTFDPAFLALARSIGVDPTKPAELSHYYREPSGLYLTGGWFHFVGSILSGDDSRQHPDGTGALRLETLAHGAEVGITRHCHLVPASFRGLALCQLEFQTLVPWVLAEAEPAP